ncbi:MAG: hypothetical protein CMD53_03070 [Gammaproteobacteria bacterium]|nr:hypothetical protein [Gammaproteobacteria bacterium]
MSRAKQYEIDLEASVEDLFWEEKTKRYIDCCNSLKELQQLSKLLTHVAAQRQTIIKGLIKHVLTELEQESTIEKEDLHTQE